VHGLDAKLDVFTAMKIQVAVFWVVIPCSDVSVKMEADRTSETFISYQNHYVASQHRRPRLAIYIHFMFYSGYDNHVSQSCKITAQNNKFMKFNHC
jgi:hypothetical protein